MYSMIPSPPRCALPELFAVSHQNGCSVGRAPLPSERSGPAGAPQQQGRSIRNADDRARREVEGARGPRRRKASSYAGTAGREELQAARARHVPNGGMAVVAPTTCAPRARKRDNLRPEANYSVAQYAFLQRVRKRIRS